MNTPRTVTHYRPLDEIEEIDDLMPRDEHEPANNDNAECDCPLPWWWVVLAGVAGGGLGYAAGKRKKDAEDDLALEP